MSFGLVLLAFVFVVIPGLGLTFTLLPPGRASLPTRVALIIPLGYSLIGLVALVLMLIHAMRFPAFVAVYVVATVAVWAFGLRRGALRENLAVWRRELVSERWPYLFGAGTIVAVAVISARFSPLLNLEAQTPLRYWADGIEIADAHRIPTETLQWGHLYPPAVSKIVMNAFDAGMSFVLGRGPLGPLGALLLVCSVGLFVAAWALALELGLRWTAPLLPLLLFANHAILAREMTTDLSRYHAENWGRLVMLAALICSVRALRAREWREGRRDGLLAGALFGIAVGTHLVPAAIGAGFVAAYALARMIVVRRAMPVFQEVGTMVAVAAVLGGFVQLAPRGDVGFQGARDLNAYAQLAKELGQPPGWDPTRYFATGRLIQPNAGKVQQKGLAAVYPEYAAKIGGHRKARTRTLVLLPVGAAVALALLLVWGSKDLKSMSIAAALMGMLLLVVAVVFSLRYQVYIFAQFGNRRLFDYAAIPVLLLALGVGEIVLVRLGGKLPVVGGPRPWVPVAASVLLLVLVGAYLLPKELPQTRVNGPLQQALGQLSWIERNVPCDGRILADRRSLAVFELLSRHAGTLEGMGPYLRPDLLATAIRAMLSARAFFKDPQAGLPYLQQNGVAIVIATNNAVPIGGTGYKVGRAASGQLSAAPFLQVVSHSDALTVYRVLGYQPSWSAPLPSVVGRPGFECVPAAA